MNKQEIAELVASRIKSSLEDTVGRMFPMIADHRAAPSMQTLKDFAKQFSHAVALAVGDAVAEAISR